MYNRDDFWSYYGLPPSRVSMDAMLEAKHNGGNPEIVPASQVTLAGGFGCKTPTLIAAGEGYADIMKLLIICGGDPNAHTNCFALETRRQGLPPGAQEPIYAPAQV